MNKNIVICSDGTGNTAIKDRGTNVFKLYEAVDLIGHRGNPTVTRQVAFYDDGVGTEGLKLLRWLGGAFGWGLGRNVRQLYAELARGIRAGGSHFFSLVSAAGPSPCARSRALSSVVESSIAPSSGRTPGCGRA